MTWDGLAKGDNEDSLRVWSLRSPPRDPKTNMPVPVKKFKVAPDNVQWPIVQWASDSLHFARRVKNGIVVYDTETMKMLEKKPILCKNIVEFSWSPSDNVIAYWCPEVKDLPSRCVLLDPIKRVELKAKNLVQVRGCKLHWHPQGHFMCAQVLRHSKSGKTTYFNLEVFRMRDQHFPNETLEIKRQVVHFSFEPQGHRFGVIVTENEVRYNVEFYSLDKVKGGKSLNKLYTLENKQCNELCWSPMGVSWHSCFF